MANVFDQFDVQPTINIFDQFDEPKKPEELPTRSVGTFAKDVGLSLAKGVIGAEQGLVGLADIPTGGRFGKYLEEQGFDFEKNQKLLEEQYSPQQKAENKALAEAEGVSGNIMAAIAHPTAVGAMLGESIPSIFAGGILGKVAKVAKGVSGAGAGAAGIGEGLIGAGSAEENIRNQSEDGLVSGKGTLAAIGTGIGTGVLGTLGAKATHALGGMEVDTLMSGGTRRALAAEVGAKAATSPNMFKRAVATAFGEGVLEEAPQSAQEKMWQNYATDKPLLEGVEDAAIKGGLLGSIMGAGVGAVTGGTARVNTIPPPATTAAGEGERKEEPSLQTEQAQAVDKKNDLKAVGLGPTHKMHGEMMQQDFSTPEGIAAAEAFVQGNSEKLSGINGPAWDKFIAASKEKAGVEPSAVITPTTEQATEQAPITEVKAPVVEEVKAPVVEEEVEAPVVEAPVVKAPELTYESKFEPTEENLNYIKSLRPENQRDLLTKIQSEEGATIKDVVAALPTVERESATAILTAPVDATIASHTEFGTKATKAAPIKEGELTGVELRQQKADALRANIEAKNTEIERLADEKRAVATEIRRLNREQAQNKPTTTDKPVPTIVDLNAKVTAARKLDAEISTQIREVEEAHPEDIISEQGEQDVRVHELLAEKEAQTLLKKTKDLAKAQARENATRKKEDKAAAKVEADRIAIEHAAAEQVAKEKREVAAKKRAATKELKAKELKAKELKAKELKAKELKTKELKAKELKAKETEAKETEATETEATETEATETEATPDGPFSSGETTAFSDQVPDSIRGVINEWKKMLGISERIYITTLADAATSDFHGPFATIASHQGLGLEKGSARRLANGDYAIAYTPAKLTYTLEILSHEMGHVLEKSMYEFASPEVKAAIDEDFKTWLASTKGKTAREHINSLRARSTAKATKIPEGLPSNKLDPYWSKKSEWFADQVARWATTSDKPLSVVEKFFQRLGQALKRFFLQNRDFLPTQTMHNWLNSLEGTIFTPESGSTNEDLGVQYSLSSTEQASVDAGEARRAGGPASAPKIGAIENIKKSAASIGTKVFSADARYIRTLRDSLEAIGLPFKDIQPLLLQSSQSQTLNVVALAERAAVLGGLKKNSDSHIWDAVDDPHKVVNIRHMVEGIAKEKGQSYDYVNSIFHDIMVARRIDEVSKRAEKIIATYKGMANVTEKDKAKRLDYANKNRKHVNLAKGLHGYMGKEEVKIHLALLKSDPAYAPIIDEWQAVRKNTIQFLVDTGRYSEEQAEAYMDAVAYVPFQRVLEGGEDVDVLYVASTNRHGGKGGLSAGQVEYSLKGQSKREVDDIVSNIEKWVVNSYVKGVKADKSRELIDLADKYLPAGAVEEVGVSSGNKTTVTCYRGGVKEHWKFKDPMMTFAFDSVNPISLQALTVGAKSANILRASIVLDPIFTIAQLPQDTFSAMFTSGVKWPFMIPYEAAKEFTGTLLGPLVGRTTKAHKILKETGAVGGKDFSEKYARSIHDTAYNIKDSGHGIGAKAMQLLNHIAMSGDNAVRQAVYIRTMKELKGNPNAEAMAKDRAFEIINFKRKGASATLDAVRQVTPFLGAYLQVQRVAYNTLSGRGISPVSREEARRTLVSTAAQVTALSIMTSVIMRLGDTGDEDDYAKRSLKERFAHIYMNKSMAIPIRNDIFSWPTILVDYGFSRFVDKSNVDAANAALGESFRRTVLGVPAGPTLIKPILESMMNHDWFTNRPIVPQRLQDRETEYQFDASTSDFSKLVGKSGLISPMLLDHLIKGTTGYAGAAMLSIFDIANRMATNAPYMGKGFYGKTIRDIPGVASMVPKEHFSQDIDTSFALREELDKAATTYKVLKGELNSPEKARQYKAEHRAELSTGAQSRKSSLVSDIDDLNKKLRKLSNTSNEVMSPTAKQERRELLEGRVRHKQGLLSKLYDKVNPN